MLEMLEMLEQHSPMLRSILGELWVGTGASSEFYNPALFSFSISQPEH